MDPYQTLKIQPGASESEVRKAFRQLALKYHPDVCRPSKFRRMQTLLLTDPPNSRYADQDQKFLDPHHTITSELEDP